MRRWAAVFRAATIDAQLSLPVFPHGTGNRNPNCQRYEDTMAISIVLGFMLDSLPHSSIGCMIKDERTGICPNPDTFEYGVEMARSLVWIGLRLVPIKVRQRRMWGR
jgi:hypothetical protein